MKVNILEAKNRLSQLIKSAQAGEEIIIANRGEPVARLVPIDPVRNYPKGSGAAILAWLEAHPIPEHVRRTEAEIEADIQEQRNSWD